MTALLHMCYLSGFPVSVITPTCVQRTRNRSMRVCIAHATSICARVTHTIAYDIRTHARVYDAYDVRQRRGAGVGGR